MEFLASLAGVLVVGLFIGLGGVLGYIGFIVELIPLAVFILAGVTRLFGVNPGAAQLLETMLVIGVCALYMLALGNISSVQYPRSLNPERVSQSAASGRFQALIMLLYPVSLLPVLLAYAARYGFGSEVAFYVVLGFAALVGGALYWIALESAVATAVLHRERILHDLSNTEGQDPCRPVK